MKQVISTTKAPAAIGPYSQAVKAGNIMYISGQLPVNPATGQMPTTVEEQTKQSLENVKAIIEEAGLDMNAVVKTTVFLKDMNQFVAMNEVYASYFSGECPARATVEVARLPKDALVEIEAIAFAGCGKHHHE